MAVEQMSTSPDNEVVVYINRTIAFTVAVALSFAAASFLPRASFAADFGISTELGTGFKHNDDGNGLFLRGMFLSDGGAGCGVIVGAWEGDFENDVAGLTCENRVLSKKSGRPLVSFGLGAVGIEPSEIVNSDWALEVHFRVFITTHFAVSLTHFSNTGAEDPNRGYNFASLELVF